METGAEVMETGAEVMETGAEVMETGAGVMGAIKRQSGKSGKSGKRRGSYRGLLSPSPQTNPQNTPLVTLLLAALLGLFMPGQAAYANHDDIIGNDITGNIWDADRNPDAGGTHPVDADSIWLHLNGSDTPYPGPFGDALIDFYNNDRAEPDNSYHDPDNKDILPIKQWQCGPVNNPLSKGNLLYGMAAGWEIAPGDLRIFGSTARESENGVTFVGIWLLGDEVSCDPNVNGGMFQGNHLDGDVLLLADFTNGGGVSTFKAFRWNDPNGVPENGDECIGTDPTCADSTQENLPFVTGNDCNAKLDGNPAPIGFPVHPLCATVNTDDVKERGQIVSDGSGPVTAPDFNEQLVPPLYFEFALNFSLLLGEQACVGTFLIESRSSAELTASLKDYTLGDLNTCGSLVVAKKTVPALAPDTSVKFDFNASEGTGTGGTSISGGPFQLADTESLEISGLLPGWYNAAEVAPLPTGWKLTDIKCLDEALDTVSADAAPTSSGDDIDVNITVGDKVTCTFTNEAPGTVIIRKISTGPDELNPVGIFGFTQDVDASGAFDLTTVTKDVAVQKTFSNIVAGTYTVTEDDPAANSFNLKTLACVDSDGSGVASTTVLATRVATINLDPGETVTCTFTNERIREPGNIIIRKQTVGGVGAFDYTGDLGVFSITTTDATVVAYPTFTSVAAGRYNVSETVPAGWDLTNLSCSDPNEPSAEKTTTSGVQASIYIDDGETVTCTYTNTKRGDLKLVKNTVGGDAEFSFTHGISGLSAALTTVSGTADDTSDKLVPGAGYAVSEDGEAGWDLTSASCKLADGTTSTGTVLSGAITAITVEPGKTTTCTFANTRRGDVDLLKLLNGVETSTAFTFTLNGPGASDLTDSSTPVIDFGYPNPPGDKWLVANATYTICEIGIPAGTTSSWSADAFATTLPFVGVKTGNLWEVYNPQATGDPGTTEDVGNRCVDFQAGPGASITFVVDNRVPLGDARTPGYWSNWSSCTNGNQFTKATAEFLGGVSPRHWTLDEILPQTIGLLTLTGDTTGGTVYDGGNDAACLDAVNILQSRSLLDGKKRANDAAYKLARSLLAYLANQVAGAYACPAAALAAVDGQALLVSIGFDGTGAYLVSGKKGTGSAANIAAALNYHGILDAYNNNNCP